MKYIYKTSWGVIAIALLLLASCKSKESTETVFNPHVLAFTSGTISKQSTVVVRLAESITGYSQDEPIEDKLFTMSPSVSGKTVMIDEQTIEFRPDKLLSPDQTYKVTFNVGKALKGAEVESKHKTFEFEFATIAPSISFYESGLELYNENDQHLYRLKGKVETSDVENDEDAEKTLSAEVGGKKMPLKWQHELGRIHFFVIDSIRAGEKAGEIVFQYNGKSVGSKQTGESKVRVPSKYEFTLLGVEVNSTDPQSVVCRFSASIDSKQELKGLITIDNKRLSYKVRLNQVTIYPSEKIVGPATLTIYEGLKSAEGGKFEETYTEDIAFETLKPQVKFVGKGTILPNSNGLVVPFQAACLKTVTARVIRIYENNVLSFLQVNALDGKRDLKRAGRLVALKTIRLNEKMSDNELKRWNTYAIDLSKIITPEPGAIYRVELSFTKADAIIECEPNRSSNEDGNETENLQVQGTEQLTDDQLFAQEEAAYDDSDSGGSYYYDYYDYDYYDNDDDYGDPCTDYYYRRWRNIARNVFASDLGVIAKMGTNNTVHAVVSNLVSLEPMKGVSVEAFNYQQQPIGKGTTDERGFANFTVKGKPFVMVAKQDKQRGYLRMNDEASLSLSRFDVAGSTNEKGLKGFIYGERGVWRPGDTLFLSFVLLDKDKQLPSGHPVGMEIVNARGQVVNKQVKTGNENNFYTFVYKTDEMAPTGNWTARVSVGGVNFTKTLKIETVKPNRIKINLSFDDKVINLDKTIKGKLAAQWLHGAPAKELLTQINVHLNPAVTKIKGFDNYIFDDATKSYKLEDKIISSGRLNAEGVLNFSTSIDVNKQAAGMLIANFTTRVFEEGGDFSIDNMVTTVSPYTNYIGLLPPKGTGYMSMLETGKDQEFEVITVSEQGIPVNISGMEVKVYKLGWSWWWSSSNYQLANYSQSSYQTPVYSSTINSVNGKARFKLNRNDSEYGTYLIRVIDPKGGHSTSTVSYFDWPNWGGRSRQESGEGATMLQFSSDKAKYNVGETAKILFPSAKGTKALVSIENGSKILQSFWLNTQDGQTEISLPVTHEMTPNVYVFVTLIQPHGQTKNDAPIRLYGVIPIVAEDPQTILNPVIDMPATIRPEEKFTIKVSESNKQNMTYTLAVVDEGLLDLTRFVTPNPWNSFYAREALGVRTWDMYDAVVGAYGGRIEQLFAIGGDASAVGNRPKVSRFKPVVRFIGPFTLGKGKTDSHELTMPNYIGSVRVMVVAGNDRAYGAAEKAVPVRTPLMVLATLPRVLGPGEEVDLPVNVFAMESGIKNVQVKIEINDLFSCSDKSQSMNFSSIGDQVINFPLKVAERIGKGTVRVTATSGSEKSVYDIEIEIRNPNPPITRVMASTIEAGKSWNANYVLLGMDGSNTAAIEASLLPPLNLERRLGYLLRYPHGCLEQITSTVFPQLYLSSIMELTKDEAARTTANIKAGLERLKNFVTLEGGFAYWPGDRFPNLWATSYAGNFIVEAKDKGYTLPYGMLDNWIKFQQRESRNWKKGQKKNGEYYTYSQDDFDQAYRLYTLAKAKVPEMGAMNRLKEQSGLSLQARWALAAAYAVAGQSETANKQIENASMDVKEYESSFSQTYGSSDRDKAFIVDALVQMKRHAQAFPLVKSISESLNAQTWMSTQTSAYCLMAIARYAESNNKNQTIELEYTFNGKTEEVNSKKPFWKVDLGKVSKGGDLVVKNKGEGIVFVQVSSTGTPLAGLETAGANGLKMSANFTNSKGSSMDVKKLQQGTDFIAEVRVHHPGLSGQNYSNIALTQIFPSGWEINNQRLLGLEDSQGYDYCDIRDDRVYTYFGLSSGTYKTFKVKLTAAYIGKFYLPAFKAEAMYDGNINANNEGMWVEVTK